MNHQEGGDRTERHENTQFEQPNDCRYIVNRTSYLESLLLKRMVYKELGLDLKEVNKSIKEMVAIINKK
jgi:hypothetical protein